MNTSSPSETETFVSRLIQNAPADLYVNLWTRQDRKSCWVPVGAGASAIAAQAQSLSSAADVYVCVSLASQAGSSRTRVKAEESAGIFGLWADIDIADPMHSKKNLPTDEGGALQILTACGLAPTIVVHSGHGLQAWWLFRQPWIFTDADDRDRAATLAQRWNKTLQHHAAQRGWTLDSTHDLARVMRIPGTWNYKGDPVPVGLVTP